MLDTLAPDEQRKRRVLTLAKKLISERDFGSKRPIDDIRKSLDELLLKYDESTYVSTDYRQSMDQAGARAAELAARGLPPEMDEWLETLGHDSVRRLSGQLLIDLLRNETVPGRMGETARDMGAFVEELLLAGAFDECLPVVEELARRHHAQAGDRARRVPPRDRQPSARRAALTEAAAHARRSDRGRIRQLRKADSRDRAAGRAGLMSAYQREDGGVATDRATALLVEARRRRRFRRSPRRSKTSAGSCSASSPRRSGKIGTGAAVAPLQSLLRRSDVRVLQTAVASLAGIDDPAAARALHTVLQGHDRRRARRGDRVARRPEGPARRADARAHPAGQRSVRRRAPAGARHARRAGDAARRARGAADRGAGAARSGGWRGARPRRLREACLRALTAHRHRRKRRAALDRAGDAPATSS